MPLTVKFLGIVGVGAKISVGKSQKGFFFYGLIQNLAFQNFPQIGKHLSQVLLQVRGVKTAEQ